MNKSPLAVLVMGPPNSGKTEVSRILKGMLESAGLRVVHLDGNELREDPRFKNLPRLGFSDADRDEQHRRAAMVSGEHQQEGAAVIASFIAPRERHRQQFRAGLENLVVIHLEVPLRFCLVRDREKGVYSRVKGEDHNDFNIGDPEDPRYFEVPRRPDLSVKNWGGQTSRRSAEEILEFLKLRNPWLE